MSRFLRAAQDWLNPAPRLPAARFDTDAPLAAPAGPYRIAHHAVVIPALPEPLRHLSVITMMRRGPGTRHGAGGGTATVTVRSAAPGTIRGGRQPLAATVGAPHDNTVFRFGGGAFGDGLSGDGVSGDGLSGEGVSGEGVALTGAYPRFRLRVGHPDLGVDLTLTATDVVTRLAALRGGAYDHQSVLCAYRGSVTHGGVEHRVGGLCALEYARGRHAGPPFRRFTYHVVDVDEDTQVLFSQILGPAGLPLFQGLHVRDIGEGSRTYRDGFLFQPRFGPEAGRELGPESGPESGPGCRSGRRGFPERFTAAVADDDGTEVFRIDAVAHPAPGPVSPCTPATVCTPATAHTRGYDYRGTLRGRPVAGTGYGEYVAR